MSLLSACAPRQAVIDSGVAATLTALVPTSLLPAGRPTSTAVPLIMPAVSPEVPTPANTAAPENTTAPADTVAPAATVAQTATVAALPVNTAAANTTGALIFEDLFDTAGPWAVGDTTDSNVAVSGGALTYAQKTPGTFSYRLIGRQGGDFRAEVSTALPKGCGSGDKFGLMFRILDASNYYLFQIDCDGRYRLMRFVGGADTPLLDWSQSPAIKRGVNAANTLRVETKGNSITVFVNGERLGAATDLIFTSGRFGLWVGSNVTNNFTVVFDELRVYQLQ
ncbi:MAG: hypothetical protein AAB427_01975 [Chloroflexota bacterium]